MENNTNTQINNQNQEEIIEIKDLNVGENKAEIKGKRESLKEVMEEIKKLEEKIIENRRGNPNQINTTEINNLQQEQSSIAWSIPLERLYVVRSNMKKFLDKWGKKPEESWRISSRSFYDNCRRKFRESFRNSLNKEKPKIESEVANVMKTDDLKRIRFSSAVSQWGGRTAGIIGGIFALTNGDKILGIEVAASYLPFEIFVSSMKRYFDFKKVKWDEFKGNSDELWNNYAELIGIVGSIKNTPLGADNEIRSVNVAITNFIGKEYDINENNEIDISELENARGRLTEDLRSEWENEDRKRNLVKKLRKCEDELNNLNTNDAKIKAIKAQLGIDTKLISQQIQPPKNGCGVM